MPFYALTGTRLGVYLTSLPGRDGQKAVAFTCPVPAGSKLTFEFRAWADYAKPLPIDPGHRGPISVYLKPVSSFDDTAAGEGWFKIWHQGYDAASDKFAVEKLVANKGLLSINLPDGIPKGRYLVRTEIIALHNVTDTAQGEIFAPQFFTNCAQLYVESDNTDPLSVPSDSKATIPGHLSASDPGLRVNIYRPIQPNYIIPGPKVFFPGTKNPTKVKAVVPLPESQGGVPETCLIKNANWCAFEVPSYTTEMGCWEAVDNCYKQGDVCYKSSPPTGSRNCDVWDRKKCDVLRDACEDKKWSGPPNKGEKLKEVFAREVPVSAIPGTDNAGAAPGVGDPEPQPVKGSDTGGGYATSVLPVGISSLAPTSAVSQKLPIQTGSIISQGPDSSAATLPTATVNATIPAIPRPTGAVTQTPVVLPSVHLPGPSGRPCKSVRAKGKWEKREFKA